MNRKIYFRVLLAMLAVISVQQAGAQLSGTYTIGGTSPDYSTLSAAVSDLNSLGVNGPVIFNIRDGNYTGSSWQADIGNVTGASATNTITFQSQSGNKSNCTLSPGGTSSANYVFYFNGAKYITVKNLTLNNTGTTYGTDIMIAGAAANNTVENCILTGNTGTSTSASKARIYGSSLASTSNISFINNLIDYGSMGFYLWGNGTTSLASGYVFDGNEFNENYYYWGYGYYLGDITFEGNTFNRSGSASSYFYGLYMYYTGNGFILKANEFNNTCNAYYNYVGYFPYTNYYTQNNSSYPDFQDNVINMSTTSSTYYNYPWYCLYPYYGNFENNTFNLTSTYTSGYIYNYFMYYGYYSNAKNNTWNINKSGGYIYNYVFYYGSNDTFVNNTINETGNAYTYNYVPYYSQNYYVANNDINVKTTSTTAYGAYVYYYNGVFANNRIKCESTSGAMYGMYLYYQQGSKIFNNTIDIKTSGTAYGVAAYYNYSPTKFFNNTIYNQSTSSSSYGMYLYNNSSSYDLDVVNNIIYKTSGNGYSIYNYYPDYAHTDYNLYYKPGGNYFYSVSPSNTSADLQDWRQFKGDDMNSLIYTVPFNGASVGDFTIDANSPAAWAVNGRGIHDTSAVLDFANNPRAGIPQDGVPDLGAYEVVPTSTPPYADAYPATPVANSDQVFVFGQDTVGSIQWGATVPSSFQIRQYTGTQAGPMPAGVGRMFFYTSATTPEWTHNHKPLIRYKDAWIGDVSSELSVVIARSSNGGAWEGYNYINAATDVNANILAPAAYLDSVGAYTGVENGRIGIRCVENPKGIRVSNVTAYTADIEWSPVFNPIGYQVIVKKNALTPTDADWGNSVLATSNVHSALGLDEDSTYYVFIRSICGIKDTSGFSMDSFTTLITCHTPDVQLTAVNSDRVISYWGAVKTAYKYEYALTASSTPPSAGTDITKTSMLENYLNNGTQYYVHVKAHCSSIYPTSQWETVPFTTWATGIANVSVDDNSIEIYPNPVVNDLGISIGKGIEAKGTATIMDMSGKVLKVVAVGAANTTINVADIPAGTYVLQFAGNQINRSVKFSKQ